jgi:hypothetical protein
LILAIPRAEEPLGALRLNRSTLDRTMREETFDYVIGGAGSAGSVLAD